MHILLVGLVVVGGLVVLQGLSSTSVEEVDAGGLAAAVGGGQSTAEEGSQADLGAVNLTIGKDTGNLDADIGHGVYDGHVSDWNCYDGVPMGAQGST